MEDLLGRLLTASTVYYIDDTNIFDNVNMSLMHVAI